jgi:hypothetical protein
MSIEKEFAPYQESLELKELGFDESCLAYWYNETPTNPEGQCLVYYKKPWDEQKIINGIIRDYYVAPTFSQAFRWFRKKYNIQGYIYSSTVRGNSEKTKQFTGYIWNINGIDMPFISTDARDELHDTYEEAELACLQKLIEIVKNK